MKVERGEREFQHRQQKDAQSMQDRAGQQEFNQILQTRRLLADEDRVQLKALELQAKNSQIDKDRQFDAIESSQS